MLQTTANTVAFTLWQLAHSPAAQASAQAEVDKSSGKLTHQALDSSYPYLDACVRESLRLESPLPAAAREAGKDCILGGVKHSWGPVSASCTEPKHGCQPVVLAGSIIDSPYLDACIRESLRLESPLPAAAREAGKDCILGGVLSANAERARYTRAARRRVQQLSHALARAPRSHAQHQLCIALQLGRVGGMYPLS